MTSPSRLLLSSICLTATALAMSAPEDGIELRPGPVEPPLDIEVLQDTELRALRWQTLEPGLGQAGGPQYMPVTLPLRKGAHFRMTEVQGEGSCAIEVDGMEYLLGECRWLAGFRDHQEQVFQVRR